MTRTLCEQFQRTAAIDPTAVALRTVGGSVQLTWSDYRDEVTRIAGGLHALGVGRGDTVALLLTNRPEFHLIDTAALHLGAIPFSVYNTLSVEQLSYLLDNAGATVVVTEPQYLDKVRAAGGRFEHVVLVEGEAEGTIRLDDVPAAPDFDVDASWRAVTPDDVATLIYTSGTTGDPKGVELTHANLAAELDGILSIVDVRYGDRITSYLPSAHIADRLSGHYVQMATGSQITTVADARQIADALADARPTFWVAVPRVWEKFKSSLEAVMSETGGAKGALLGRAVALGHRRGSLNALERAQLAVLDKVVLAKIRSRLGLDELRWALCGAAPIAPETLDFFRALGLEVLEMWGMSECCGAGLVNPPGAVRSGSVGVPLSNLETRVAADGELLVRGPIVMTRYRNDPERTAAAFVEDGWFATGDVVDVDADGYITIVDRKKELIINAGGKNMSPSNIENTIKAQSPMIASIVAIGDNRPYNTALVVLDPELVAEVTPAVLDRVRREIAIGNERLARIEQIKRFTVVTDQWQPGGAELTPTMKLKRRPIAEKYAAAIESLYAARPGGTVVEVSPPRA